MSSRITDYSFLFQNMNKSSGVDSFGRFNVSNINSKGIQSQLRASGIDTNSKAYKRVVGEMMKVGGGRGIANIQGIKNLMKNYDADGDYISPVTGLAGMDATNIPISKRHVLIDIPKKKQTRNV